MNLLHIFISCLPGALLFACVFSCSSVLLYAQPSDTIVANPKAVTLRHIWKVTGTGEQDRVGIASGSLGDISGDGLGDFAVADIKSGAWKIYMGGNPAPDTIPEWVFEDFSGSLSSPVVGDFFGTGQKIVVFARDTCDENSICFFRLFFFKASNGTLETTPVAVLNTGIQFCARDVLAADLDGDGADELILSRSCSFPEVWIYKGGAEFLPNGQPDILIADRDNNSLGSSRYNTYIADFDNDGRLDMGTIAPYTDQISRFKIWFGDENSPWDWEEPDRTVELVNSGLNLDPIAIYLDGDPAIDLVGTVYEGDARYIHFYLSGSGKDFRTRSFTKEDADNVFATHMLAANTTSVGYLNDSSRTHEMLPLIGPSFYDRFEPMLLLFSGGENGPDAAWDAVYAPSRDGVTAGGVMQHIHALPDCNGDGWDDLLISDDDWWMSIFKFGIAMVLAGGPEIPTTGVREEPVAGEAGGLSLWPNPVRDELHVAWKGNLKKMPHRFAVHDMGGRRVAGGAVEPYVGSAVWRCGDAAAGVYVLTAYDEAGGVIATARVVKE